MTSKLACAFPGQGIQEPAMASALQNTSAWALYTEASEILGYDLGKLCLEGTPEELGITSFSQPAIFVTCFALWTLVRDFYSPKVFLGHSLGEITALTAAGAFTFQDAVRLVAARGKLMSTRIYGGMVAVLGLEKAEVHMLCTEITDRSEENFIQVANVNSPEQIVVSGLPAGLKLISELAPKRGARRVISLRVSGPFHSELMLPAAQEFGKHLKNVEINNCTVPVLSNDGTTLLVEAEQIRTNLVSQIVKPVQFVASIKKLVELGVDHFVEISPKRLLSPLVGRITADMKLSLVSEGGM